MMKVHIVPNTKAIVIDETILAVQELFFLCLLRAIAMI